MARADSRPSPSPPTQRPDKLGLREVVAMGVGGMVGGGIFSVLGLAIAEAGHAAPIAFALGGVIALVTGLSYARLGLLFHSSGGSFTFLEHAFANPNIAAIGGWLLLVGYVGTMALYAFTFGIYGSAMLGGGSGPLLHHLLESAILLVFLGINLHGVRTSGTTELVIVAVKVAILFLFAGIGLFYARADHLLPLFDRGYAGVVLGATLIFVAYEGFELIPNAIDDMEDPQRNLKRGILWSILVTILVYLLVSTVAVGNLTPPEIAKYKEYALAVAARPFLGQTGFLLIGLAALFSTASAINATLFGTARLGTIMARDRALPKIFGIMARHDHVPWVSLTTITIVTLLFVNFADLTVISSFASSTFLLIFAIVNWSAWCLRRETGGSGYAALVGLFLSLASWLALMAYLWTNDPRNLYWIGVIYSAVVVAELLFSERRLLRRGFR